MTLGDTTVGASRHPSVSGKSSDVRRLVLAALSIPILYVLIRYLPSQAFSALTLVTAVLALREFYRLYYPQDQLLVEHALGSALTGILFASIVWPLGIPERALWCGALFAVVVWRVASKRALKPALTDSAVLLFGVLYVGLTLSHLVLLRELEDGVLLVFMLLLVTWGGDTGAYLAGKAFGRHKLAPAISPNKTVEGLCGGLLFAVMGAMLSQLWFLPSFSLAEAVVLGLVLGGAGVIGDLAESAMKRSAGVKDSGHLLPGHGGVLDRIDSLLFTAPTFYYYMTLVTR